MKKILIYCILIICIISGCKKVKRISYSGVYKLEKQTVSGKGLDTTLVRQQIKIYTDRHYIYAGISPDSVVKFGLGTYELDTANTIVEHNIFNSKALDSMQIFVVHIKRTNNGFTGTTPEWARSGDTMYKLTEDYTNVPSLRTSDLDGVWELDKIYWVKGKDTTRQHETRFKVFWQGHFMFIHRYPINPVGTLFKNGFGYGTFSLKGDTLSETEAMSSHAELLNRQFAIKLTLKANEYTQVLIDPKTREQTTEIYKRIRTY